jgi:hypothetical protein
MDKGHQQDVCHLLHISLEGLSGGTTTSEELSRIWSLELQWFTPEEADEIVAALTERGWLTESESKLSPSPGLELSRPPLGWRPTPRRLLELPQFQQAPLTQPASVPELAKAVAESKPMPKVSDPTPSALPPDRAEGSIPHLIGMIADKSALENKEVMRRAQRKRRALGPVTLWMALALVAKEQGLDMHDVTAAIKA